MKYSGEQLRKLGLDLIGKPLNHSLMEQDRTFRSHFGVGWMVASSIWNTLDAYSIGYIQRKPCLQVHHLFWGLHFLKNYPLEDQASQLFKTTRKTYRKWVWLVVGQLEDLAEEFKERLLTIECDVSNEEDVKKAIAKTIDKFGTIHVAIANAGIAWPSQTIDPRHGNLDLAMMQKMLAINVMGTANVAKHAALQMQNNSGKEKGLILMVSSVAAWEG